MRPNKTSGSFFMGVGAVPLNSHSVLAGDGDALNVSSFSLASGALNMDSQIRGSAFADHQTRENLSREREQTELDKIKRA